MISSTEAELAEVDWSTVQRFESVDGIPPSRSGTLGRVQSALEVRGIVFLGDPVSSPGVQLKPSFQPKKDVKCIVHPTVYYNFCRIHKTLRA
jgi:hypothetical protein